MKLVIAPDSFKEAASAAQVAAAVAEGWGSVWPETELRMVPMADGGEGTLDALVGGGRGRVERVEATGPLGEPVAACLGFLDEGRAAVVESAQAVGLSLIPPGERNPARTTTFGVGEMIVAALDRGARRILVAVGGTSTNDGGAGMAQALGVSLKDAEGRELRPGGEALLRLDRVDSSGLDPRIAKTEILVACDVNNPLCGPTGASLLYSPQKGADPEMAERLDDALAHFAGVVMRDLDRDMRLLPGGGAAGGLGAGLAAFLGARLVPGVEVVAREAGLEAALRGADLAITGEGRLDAQSLWGKVPVGVARLARAAGVPVIALAGSLSGDLSALYAEGLTAAFALADGPVSLEESMAATEELLRRRSAMLARIWRAAREAQL